MPFAHSILLAHPAHTLRVLLALQFVLWLITPILVYHTVPMDIMEFTIWGREGIIAGYNHPGLPGFILATLHDLTGGAHWAGYLAAQICVVVTLWLIYRLSCLLLKDDSLALAATVLMMGTVYYSTLSMEFNHNILQMPFWAAAMVAIFHATRDAPLAQNLRWWLALGALLGVLFYVKYAAVILYATAALWLFYDKKARLYLSTAAPYLTLLLALLIMTPLFLWLIDNHQLAFGYMQRRGAAVSDKIWLFPFAQILNHAAILVILLLAGGVTRLSQFKKPPHHASFLFFFAVTPILLTFGMALLLEQGIRTKWAVPMTILWGTLAVATLHHQWNKRILERIVLYGGILVLALPFGYSVMRVSSPYLTERASRIHAPSDAIVTQLQKQWYEETQGEPLAIVGGFWEAMIVAFHNKDQPSLWVNLNQKFSHNLTDEVIAQKGALVVWGVYDHQTIAPPHYYERALRAFTIARMDSLTIPYKSAPHLAPLHIGYAIIKPQSHLAP